MMKLTVRSRPDQTHQAFLPPTLVWLVCWNKEKRISAIVLHCKPAVLCVLQVLAVLNVIKEEK